MPKLPRSTSSATSSMASGTIPSRPAKPYPDRLKIMHLFPDRPLGQLHHSARAPTLTNQERELHDDLKLGDLVVLNHALKLLDPHGLDVADRLGRALNRLPNRVLEALG